MKDIDEKLEVKNCFESNTPFCASSNDEEYMPYNVLLHNCHMTSL